MTKHYTYWYFKVANVLESSWFFKGQLLQWKVCLVKFRYHISHRSIGNDDPWSKVRTFWETHKIWKNLPNGFDKSADLLSKCQNHEEDFFQIMCASQKVRTLLTYNNALVEKFELSLNWAKNHFMTRDREINDTQIKYILSIFLKIAKSSNSN